MFNGREVVEPTLEFMAISCLTCVDTLPSINLPEWIVWGIHDNHFGFFVERAT